VPLRVNASAVAKVKPARSRVPFVETVVPAAAVPRGESVPNPAPPNFNVPAEIVVRPVYWLEPDKINVPDPSLVNVPEPVLIVVLTVVLPLPPIVKLILVAVIESADLFKVKVPESELILEAVAKVINPP